MNTAVEQRHSSSETLVVFLTLTHREKKLLKLLTIGYSNRQAADHMYVSLRTIEFHKSNLKQKIGAVDLKDLVNFVNTIQDYGAG